jgi:hypothetical protein
VIGSVLVQPQRIRRATIADPDMVLLMDVLNLATRLVMDQAQGGHILEAIDQAMETTTLRLRDRSMSGMASAQQKLQAWLRPLADFFDQSDQTFSAIKDAKGATDAVQLILTRLAHIIASLSTERLRLHVEQVLDIVRNDLGLSSTFLQGQIWALLDEVVTRLQGLPSEPDLTARQNRLDAISILRRIKRRLYGPFRFPELNADQITTALLAFLRRSGVDRVIDKAVCVGGNMGDAFKVGADLVDLLTGGNGTRSTASGIATSGGTRADLSSRAMALKARASRTPDGREQFCWYASWLLGDKDRPWYFSLIPGLPKDEIWVDRERRQVIRRNHLRADQTLFEGSNADWPNAPAFQSRGSSPDFTFASYEPETLESWAFATAVAGNGLELLLHLLSLEKGDYASNAINGAVNLGLGLNHIFRQNPLPWWVEWPLLRILGTLLASFEGMHTRVSFANWFLMWLTLVGPDMGEMVIYNSTAGGLRDLILSFMTLRNHTGSPGSDSSQGAQNYKEVSGVMGPFISLASKLHVMSVPREDYCHPFQDGGAARLWLLWMLLAGIGFGLLGGVVGIIAAYLIAGLRSGDEDWGHIAKELGLSVLKLWGAFWPSLYMDKDGDTDGGRYNPNGATFRGYPPAGSSPYNLPYRSGLSVYVGQGNQGMFSHNFINGSQVYAYDFSMDQDEEILASRPGTVVDFFDWAPDDSNVMTNVPAGVIPVPGQTTSQQWNFITIRHDRDDNGNLLANSDPTHDLGPGGAQVWTYAVYGHGRQNSVREAFAQKLGIPSANITPAQIIGRTVRRGEPIMLAGDTGISFHNHLHMHVLTGPPPPTVPVSRGMLSAFTIPFVFREVTNFLGTDGVCTRLNFYTSNNTRIA